MKKIMKIMTCIGIGTLIIGCGSKDSTKTMVCETKTDLASMKVELEYKDNMVFKETMSVEQKLEEDQFNHEEYKKGAEEYYKNAGEKFISTYENGVHKWSVSLNFKKMNQKVADEMSIPLDEKDGVTFVDLDQTITSLEGMGATCK